MSKNLDCSACILECGQKRIIFKSLSIIRCSPSITHRALRDYKSLGFARFLAFSLLVAKLGLLNICFAFPPPYRRDLWVLWVENCFLLCLARPLHHCLEHPCTCWGLLLGEQTDHHLGGQVKSKVLKTTFSVFLPRARRVPWRYRLCSLFPLQCDLGHILPGGVIRICLRSIISVAVFLCYLGRKMWFKINFSIGSGALQNCLTNGAASSPGDFLTLSYTSV